MRLFYVVFLFVIFENLTWSQVTFQKDIPSSELTSIISGGIVESISGNIFVVSSQYATNNEGLQYLSNRLIKLSTLGSTVFDTTYNHTTGDELHVDIINSYDSDAVILACTSTAFHLEDEDKSQDILIWKINSDGDILWQLVLSAFDFKDITRTETGLYAITGTVFEGEATFGRDCILYLIDDFGNVILNKRYGKKDNINFPSEIISTVRVIGRHIYIMGSRTFTTKSSEGFLYKLNMDGDVFWEIDLVTDVNTEINSIFRFNSINYIVTTDGVYSLNDNYGTYQKVESTAIIYATNKGYNYYLDCSHNKLSTINFDTIKGYTFSQYSSLTTSNLLTEIPVIDGSLAEIISLQDGGTLILTGNGASIQVTKVDCQGNFIFWSDDCVQEKHENVIVYPNPTVDVLNISSSFDFETLSIYNNTGKKVIEKMMCSCDSQVIDVSLLAIGMYHLVIETNGSLKHSTFIKR